MTSAATSVSGIEDAAATAPGDLVVVLGRGVRRLAGGRTLVGGTPFRLMTLTGEGAAVVDGWRRPAPIGDGAARRRLAQRLLDAGVLVPRPAPAPLADLTVIVPVRDRAQQLARCLEALRAAAPESSILVIDDGSVDAAAVARACGRFGAQVLRHDASAGPAAARNTGLASCATAIVACVDSDVVVPPDALRRLAGHFADPRVGAVAPRVRALRPARGLVGGYEMRHSALDMGSVGGLAGPGRAVSYVPGTVLLLRRAAVGAGFDPALRVGEDVDLVWRLTAAGWGVRYVPEVEVWHEHRVRLGPFARRRIVYARSTATLARRHPGMLPAVWARPVLAAPWLLVVAGRRRAAAAAVAVAIVRAAWRRRRTPGWGVAPASGVVAKGLLATGEALAHAVRRAWSPPLALLAVRHRTARRVVLASFAVPLVRDAWAARSARTVAADVPMRLLDELLAAAGTWDGCRRERTVRPLLPAVHAPAPDARGSG
jgi:mycofactocin system glycosyltransferase